MADVVVKSGSIADDAVSSLTVEMYKLGSRTIDRDTALSWLKDGHSLVPEVKGQRLHPLQLVEVGETLFIRHDNAPEAKDSLPAF